jgi:hypothetical protein
MIDIYHTGRVLYPCCRSPKRTLSDDHDLEDGVCVDADDNHDDDDDGVVVHDRCMRDVVISFDTLMRALPRH